jgi:hypothetical protein
VTASEEEFLQNVLLAQEENIGALDRQEMAKQLEATFEGMKSSFRCNQVLKNAHANGRIHMYECPFLHIVGLNKAALALEMKKTHQGLVLRGGDVTIDLFELPSSFDEDDDGNGNEDDIDDGGEETAIVVGGDNDTDAETVESRHSGLSRLIASSASSSVQEKLHDQTTTPHFSTHIDERGNVASSNLHVSGFGIGTTKQAVYHLFKPFCQHLEVVSKVKGAQCYMFVNTGSTEEAVDARLQLHGKVLNEGQLKINFAKS